MLSCPHPLLCAEFSFHLQGNSKAAPGDGERTTGPMVLELQAKSGKSQETGSRIRLEFLPRRNCLPCSTTGNAFTVQISPRTEVEPKINWLNFPSALEACGRRLGVEIMQTLIGIVSFSILYYYYFLRIGI